MDGALTLVARLVRLLLLAAHCGFGAGWVEVGAVAAHAEATLRPYTIAGVRYNPAREDDYSKIGVASWYGPGFHGRSTANGERFDKRAMTAAHPTLPMGTQVSVTNLDTGAEVVLRINDRGPFARGRIIDVSEAAAEALGFKRRGLARVRVENLAGAGRPQDQARAPLMVAAAEREAPLARPAAAPAVVTETESARLIAASAPTETLRPVPLGAATALPATFTRASGVRTVTAPPPFVSGAVLVTQTPAGEDIYSLGAASTREAAESLAAQHAGLGVVQIRSFEVAGQAVYQVMLEAAPRAPPAPAPLLIANAEAPARGGGAGLTIAAP